MQQMNPGESYQERPGTYGRYEGNQIYNQQSNEPYGPGASVYDDEFIDTFAQRLSQRMSQGPIGKLQPSGTKGPSSGQRLALAIVSLSLLTFIAMVGIGNDFSSFALLPILGIIALSCVFINAIFNNWRPR